jgi:D-glycero-D-manno-heptose 1,7-bisphosphate phosphatase
VANRAVFIDRDGTMARDVSYCRRPEDFDLFSTTAKAVKLLGEHGFKVIVITNQSGVARGYFSGEMLTEIHRKMEKELAREGAHLDAIYYCPHHPDDNCQCRKPKPGLVLQAAQDHDIDLERSFVIGDMPLDIAMGKAVNCRTVLIAGMVDEANSGYSPDYVAGDLYEAARWVLSQG